jgi:hypothetical protein
MTKCLKPDTQNTLPYGNASLVGEYPGTSGRMFRNTQWSGKIGQRAQMYPTTTTGYTNDHIITKKAKPLSVANPGDNTGSVLNHIQQ